MRRFVPECVLLGLLLTQVGCSDSVGFGEGPLSLRSASPAAAAAGVSVLASVTIRFSVEVDAASLTEGVGLVAAGQAVMVERSLSDDRTLVVTPADPMDFGSEYRVVLTPSLTSRSGVPLDGTISWTFTTRGLPPPMPSQDSLLRHLGALAHDSMRGRLSGSVDELRAARYLEDRLLAYGLHAPAGGMIQSFDAISRRGDTLLSSQNVLAEVPGSGGLADEWLVVGAHYDHIGYRGLVDEAQGPDNGADDNASGTVLVLEMARLLEEYVELEGMAGTDRRSVLFIAFGAEEEGLLGSCHYVFEAPEVPLRRTRAMMNFDMVGRLRNDALVVSGQETAEAWTSMVANANAPEIFISRPVVSAPTGTDHACFWQAGIPWLGFFTGFHDEYHGPGDDVALINFPGLGRIGELGFRILTRLLVMPEPPAFVGPIPALTAPRRNTALDPGIGPLMDVAPRGWAADRSDLAGPSYRLPFSSSRPSSF